MCLAFAYISELKRGGQIFKSKCCSVNRIVIFIHLGPDVQSIVSLTISLVNDSLSLLVYIKSNMLVFYFIFFYFSCIYLLFIYLFFIFFIFFLLQNGVNLAVQKFFTFLSAKGNIVPNLKTRSVATSLV